jgi:hypothetical protein
MHLLWSAAVAAGDICDNRAGLEAFQGNLRLHIIGPSLATRASIHFDTRRQRSSHVVRMVVHCEHSFQKMTLLAMLEKRRTDIRKGSGTTLTLEQELADVYAKASHGFLRGRRVAPAQGKLDLYQG